MTSSIFCRLLLLRGLMLGVSSLWIDSATSAVDAASAPGGTVEEREPNDGFGVLEFRIAPRRPSFRGASPFTKQEVAQFRKDLTENGPSASIKRDDEFVWMKIMPGVGLSGNIPHLMTEEYQGAAYLLVHNWPPFVMSSKTGWGLKSVTKDTKDAMGRPAIGIQFNSDGADRLYYLTSAYTGQTLAIIIGGEVVSAPNIHAAVGNQAVITGDFTAEQIDDMVNVLRKIVRPVSSTTAPAPRRVVSTYLIPILILMLAVSIAGFFVYR